MFVQLAVSLILSGSIEGAEFLSARLSNDSDNCNRTEVLKTDIKIYYYSKHDISKPRVVDISDPYDLKKTRFSKNKDNYFYIHGFQELPLASGTTSQRLKLSVLMDYDVNFFLVDWSAIAHVPIQIYYVVVITKLESVGRILGSQIKSFVEHNQIEWSKVQIVGHSLGAHVAGIAGRAAGGNISQILGLDPAGPSFSLKNTATRLTKSSAKFVEVIHTSSSLGFYHPIGHADYYPNGGTEQPMCSYNLLDFLNPSKLYDPTIEDSVGCSHSQVVDYYIESLRTDHFKAKKCDNFENFTEGKCEYTAESTMGGFYLDKNASGVYYLDTYFDPPYAKG